MMSSFQVVDSSPGSSVSIMETSNFAHVIFQNVGKSFLPQAPLECRYTLTPYITPNPKDWVGIFKVGWSTARDYYTFLWSPTPENYEPGSTVHRTVVFQGYYVPKSDGEFYQFCYVTHTGDIRGASTPFMFRSATPTEEELLTVTEDDSNSDILVVTTKTGLLEEQRVEEAQHERRELLKSVRLLQEEKQQLQDEQKRLTREREQERETCTLLRTHNQELLRSSQGLSEEREEVRRRLTEATDRVRQLEEDLLGVTQRGLQKETELDCLRDRLKALAAERDSLESHLKNEKDERDLYKAHLRSTEQENTKLSAELQMLKAVELNREVTIAQFQEEMDRLRGCVVQRDSLEKELLAYRADKAELARVREQLRQTDDQLQASRQQASMLAAELRDTAGARDRSVAELYRARLEVDKLRASLADAQDECLRMESRLERVRSATHMEAAVGTGGEGSVVSEAEAELQREVEELKLRLHMAAEHYKEKYRECQRLRRQVAKLSETQGESKRNAATETIQETMIPSPESPTEESISATVLRRHMTITPLLLSHEEPPAHTDTHTVTLIDTPPDTQIDTISDTHIDSIADTHIDTRTDTSDDTCSATEEEEEERQGDGDKERAEGEEDGEKEDRAEEEGRESPLRMTSWVEVENERRSAEENEEEEEEEEEGEEEESSGEEEEEEDDEEEAGSTAEMEEVAEEGARSDEEVEKEEQETRWVEEELAQMEEKWREQCAINETLKQRLAYEEERFRVHMAERASEVTELKRSLAQALQDKEHLQEELQRYVCRQREQEAGVHGAEVQQTVVLRYPLPYPQDPSPPPLVPYRPAELQYGNPYSTDNTRDGGDGALSPDQTSRPPPEAPPCTQPCAPPINPPSPEEGGPGHVLAPGATSWDQGRVVCIQPSRSMSPPDGLEHPPDEPTPPTVVDAAQPPCDHLASSRRNDARRSFCFDSSNDVHRRCPLCEVIFPPHFEQRSFEQHVESHWKVCPVCSEQFPLNCQQQLFERHVLTHFDGHVLNFDQIE